MRRLRFRPRSSQFSEWITPPFGFGFREIRRQVSVVSHTARLLESGPLEVASWGMKPGLIIEPIWME
jgi:hypothetical protein